MKVLYNKNDKTEMNALMEFERCAKWKKMDYLLGATLPTELFMLTTNSFQNHT